MSSTSFPPTKTVLVVENDVDLRQVVETTLEELHVTVACASDGQEALAYLEEHEAPSLILLDFYMPNMDGFAFRAKQLKNDRLREVPVIFMTGMNQIPPQRDELNGVHCIKKPFDQLELLSAVRQYMT